jgi:hypothetical protein
MKTVIYNDMEFSIEKSDRGWSISRKVPNGTSAQVGAGLFADLSDADAAEHAEALIKTIFPAGVNIVGPNVAHPNSVGDIKIVGPDVGHPNFIYWNKDSTSFAELGESITRTQ